MRDYVILNGIKSTAVNGLLIQTLPPISKPLMRTEIEQIDGRDGDIVTKLGYSAYDKVMTIGLYGDYDVNEVIAFFDSQGTVTFSNEPDKYYNYQILNQIDFEKLLRFKEATVTFHVQPFKYSAVEGTLTADVSGDKPISLPAFSKTENGVTVTASDGSITITGKGISGATEVYIPINPLRLAAGDYTLNVTATGTGAAACPMRLIQTAPTDAQSFGGGYVTPTDGQTVSMGATLGNITTYNYLWFYVAAGTKLDVTLTVAMGTQSVYVTNTGNTFSRPTVTVYGEGTVNLYVNGTQVFVIDIGAFGSITIDAAEMNAYLGEILMNRQVTGDYDNFVLRIGGNVISWSGSVAQIEVANYSRWI